MRKIVNSTTRKFTVDPFPTKARGTIDRGDGYDTLLSRIAMRPLPRGPLFTTAPTATLSATFLANLPAKDRQIYACRCCQRFIDAYGGLIAIDPTHGTRQLVVWPEEDAVPRFFKKAVAAVRDLVLRAPVTGLFAGQEPTWGWPETGPWRHLAVPQAHGFRRVTPELAAEKKEEFGMVCRALEEFDLPHIREAVRILEAGALDRSEKTVGPARWFLALAERVNTTHIHFWRNIVWSEVAQAPAGFCHIKSSMLGTLLMDLKSGMGFAEVAQRFNAKMHPTAYMRPVAAPSEKQLEVAERRVAELGVAASLPRRFATLDDVRAFGGQLWEPGQPDITPPQGVFGHLRRRPEPRLLPEQVMTWVKFRAEILPQAQKLEVHISPNPGAYSALVTACDMTASNLLQWDNPVSWYLYLNGAPPTQWNLTRGEWREVTMICGRPPMWGSTEAEAERHGLGVILALKDCYDVSHVSGGGMFCESLRPELREIRATLESYFARAAIQGKLAGNLASGLHLQKGARWDAVVRVDGNRLVRLDRWD